MTSNDQPLLVVAKFKDSSATSPRFTKTTTIEALFQEVIKTIPIDLLYIVKTGKDGLSYTLEGIGSIGLTFYPNPDLGVKNHQEHVAVQTESLSLQAPQNIPEKVITPPTPVALPEPQVSSGNLTQEPPVPNQRPQFDNAFNFQKPKSQSELLAAAGVVEKKVKLHTPRESDSEPLPKASSKKKAKVKSEDLPDSELPNTVSRSVRKVTHISQATQAEAEAASKQIFK